MRPATQQLAGPHGVAASVAAGVLLALAAPAVLSGAARPAGLDRRVATLQSQIDTVATARDAPGDATAYGLGALCTGGALREAALLQAELQRRGQAIHLARLQTSAEPEIDEAPAAATASTSTGGLQPVSFRVEANGDYAAAVGLLQGLAAHAPAVLLDRVDLSSQGSFLHLHMAGRVYCRARATS